MKDGLEKDVICLIERLYECIFDAPLEVKVNDNLYIVTLYLNGYPLGGTTYSYQCDSDEEFLKLLEKDLRKNRLDFASYGQLVIYAEH